MSFKSYLTSTCTIQSLSTGVDSLGYAQRTYSTGTNVICRKTPAKTAGETDAAGRVQDITRDKLFFEADVVITERHRIQFAGDNFNVLRVDSFPGGSGTTHHHEVMVGRAD